MNIKKGVPTSSQNIFLFSCNRCRNYFCMMKIIRQYLHNYGKNEKNKRRIFETETKLTKTSFCYVSRLQTEAQLEKKVGGA